MQPLPEIKTLAEIALLIDAEVVGDPNCRIKDLAPLHSAGSDSISFIINNNYRKYLADTSAAAIIVAKEHLEYCSTNALVVNNARLALAKLLQLFKDDIPTPSIHPSAIIGDNCTIGQGTVIHPHVTLYKNVTIGENCIIHSGAVIGSDGFGYAFDNSKWVKMLHLGGVIIGNNVEIGANTTIDRGLLEDTIIAADVIIDNQVQIGHNVQIGRATAIAGCVGIAGSTKIGSNCLIGGKASIAGHIEITDNVQITATSAVNRSLTKPGSYSSGMPAKESKVWNRNAARFNSLDDMAKRLRKLEYEHSRNN